MSAARKKAKERERIKYMANKRRVKFHCIESVGCSCFTQLGVYVCLHACYMCVRVSEYT